MNKKRKRMQMYPKELINSIKKTVKKDGDITNNNNKNNKSISLLYNAILDYVNQNMVYNNLIISSGFSPNSASCSF